jgi:hypothetical protein
MRIFEHPNPINFLCPICGTRADAPVILRGIPGTRDGNIEEAEQVHAACTTLVEMMRTAKQV